jgi:hypothetical protein
MPHRLEYLSDDKILNLQEAALLLGLEHLTIEYLANRKAYELKSKVIKAKRTFVVSDLRAFLNAREQACA